MHTLKVIALLVALLLAMRAASWLVGWGLTRWAGCGRLATAALANLAGFGGFAGLLYWSRLPGEGIDRDAALFGAAVYLLCAVCDLFWVPWRRGSGR